MGRKRARSVKLDEDTYQLLNAYSRRVGLPKEEAIADIIRRKYEQTTRLYTDCDKTTKDLSDEEKKNIVQEKSKGATARAIARKYGVKLGCIAYICHRAKRLAAR